MSLNNIPSISASTTRTAIPEIHQTTCDNYMWWITMLLPQISHSLAHTSA